ncbi:Gfo/Idh/MocA family oxidoreductase [Paenibacillus sp. TRM 82003]|nr:Gfo/Idh/MocA family oxidoreductase [Paenibacillus sp. TRM 82003]
MVRFGIVGTNWITDAFMEAGKEAAGFEATAVYSRTRERADAFGEKHGVTHRYSDLRAFAASNEIDAVYIASPNALHAEQAMLCMEQGKHVLCEKPIASNAAETARMFETAARRGVLLMEAMKTTFLPNFEAIRDLLPRIGRVRRVFASYCQYSSRYDAYRSGTVLNAFDPTLSNGALMDLGIYCIYPTIRLFGAPEAVKANAVMLESGVDGAGSLLLSYEEMEAVVIYSKITSSSLPCEIQGEDGNIVFDKMSEPSRVTLTLRDGRPEDHSRPQSAKTMRYEIEGFMRAIREGAKASEVNSPEMSLTTMRTMDEARHQFGLVYPADGKRS